MPPELPRERLSTTDETGRRVYLYPAKVRGPWHGRKRLVHAFLMLLFLLLPWLKIGGRQLLLLDIGRREFFIFGLHLRSHDAPLLVFVFLAFAFLIGGITAIWGRLWCGWACPQTVFIEFLFQRIESWIEGSDRDRRRLDAAPWGARKASLKALKWTVFAAVSMVVSHSFLAYFVGSGEVLGMVLRPPEENWASFLVVMFTTGLILFDFGWFREQFCVILCPYGRFQSVLMDARSLVVAYDGKRGEPRRRSAADRSVTGSCVSCSRCVQVCPTGIDIRRGLQMECIACTACIDACDAVMLKLGEPKGLIRYTTQTALEGSPAGRNSRAWIYGALLGVTLCGLFFSLGTKNFLEVELLRAPGLPYEIQPGGGLVVNHFRIDISNQTGTAASPVLRLGPELRDGGIELLMPLNGMPVAPGSSARVDFFLRFPQSALRKGARTGRLVLESASGRQELEVTIVGPNG